MYIYCFKCKIIDASHNDMFKSYNLDPLVDAYSWLYIFQILAYHFKKCMMIKGNK